MNSAVPDTVLVSGTARPLRQKRLQVLRIANTQFFDVSRTVRIDRIRAGLYCGGNVRAGNNDTFDFGLDRRSRWKCWKLSKCN